MAWLPPLLNVVWLSTAQLFKQGIQLSHPFASYIYQIRNRVIRKWASFHGTIGGKNMWQGRSMWIQITIQRLIMWLTGEGMQWYLKYISIFWFLEPLHRNTPLRISFHLFPSHQMHTDPTWDPEACCSSCLAPPPHTHPDDWKAENHFHLVANTWIFNNLFIPVL